MLTREEAKYKVINYALGLKVNDGINTMEELIDKIYDEHDLEMKAKDEEIERLKEAMREFVSRVEKGEVRSKYTYSKFKELLKDNA